MNEATEGIHCASCGKVFRPARRDAATCGAACRQRLHRKRSRRAILCKRIERAKKEMREAERLLAALDDADHLSVTGSSVTGLSLTERPDVLAGVDAHRTGSCRTGAADAAISDAIEATPTTPRHRADDGQRAAE